MKSILLSFILFLFFFTSVSFSQTSIDKYIVYFKDKHNTPYQLDKPNEFLSEAATNRRIKQHIAIDSTDLPVNTSYLDSITQNGAIIFNSSKWFNSAIFYTSDSIVLQKINSFPFVKNTNTVAKYKLGLKIIKYNPIDKSTFIPHNFTSNYQVSKIESNFNNFYGNFEYGLGFNQINMTQANYLHNIGFQGQGMTIAILDAGFWGVDTLKAFDTLWMNGQIKGNRDFVEPGGSVFNQSTHGMMVLSLIGWNIPLKLVGTAPKASFWLIRTEDGATENIIEEFNWAAGAEFADSVGADIINSSLGYTRFDDSTQNHTYGQLDGKTTPVTIAAEMASSKGILVVNSAGNSGTSDWHYISAPADAAGILTVGAVDKNRQYASFSSKGPTFDRRIKPNVCTQGLGSYVANISGEVSPGNGTSFSSPIMAGMAACLWQAHPESNRMDIIKAIEQSSSQYLLPDTLEGYGIPNLLFAHLLLSKVSISNFDTENEFNVFPNPFYNDINLIFQSKETAQVIVEIFDMNGKLVFKSNEISRNKGMNSIYLSGYNQLNKGIYSIILSSNGKQTVKKIFKL